MSVTIENIKKLRDMTGAGMITAKAALVETNGDIDASAPVNPSGERPTLPDSR